MLIPVRPAVVIQAEIASRRSSATAELFLIKGDIRALTKRAEALNEILEACNTAAIAIDQTENHRDRSPSDAPDLRTHILLYVQGAGRTGVTTNQVVDHVTDTFRKKFHPKTPLMTLSRLKAAGLIARSCKRWHGTD